GWPLISTILPVTVRVVPGMGGIIIIDLRSSPHPEPNSASKRQYWTDDDTSRWLDMWRRMRRAVRHVLTGFGEKAEKNLTGRPPGESERPPGARDSRSFESEDPRAVDP